MENYSRVLERVEDDLALGHTYVAIQRLTTLVQQNPGDLTLRERLAAVHLRTGNLVEAGRWSYLSANPDQAARDAFDRAFPHPRARRDALRLPPGLHVLDAEIQAADHQPSGTPLGQPSPWHRILTGLGCTLMVICTAAFLFVWGLGIHTLFTAD